MVTLAQIEWINNNVGIEDYLEELGVNIPANGKVFCPFHYNVNTPAAKVYDKDGKQCLYCYTERRFYGTFDVMRKLGYPDEKIHEIVPREYWYTMIDEQKVNDIKVPEIPESIYADSSNVFTLLNKLDTLWENADNVKCRKL
jgi:hypothetical protein